MSKITDEYLKAKAKDIKEKLSDIAEEAKYNAVAIVEGALCVTLITASIISLTNVNENFSRAYNDFITWPKEITTSMAEHIPVLYNGKRHVLGAQSFRELYKPSEYDIITNIEENSMGIITITLSSGTVAYHDECYTPTFTSEIWNKIQSGELKYKDGYVLMKYDNTSERPSEESIIQDVSLMNKVNRTLTYMLFENEIEQTR